MVKLNIGCCVRTKRKKVLNTFSACLSFLDCRFMTIEYWSLAPRRGAAHRQWEHKIYLTGLGATREGRKPAPSLRTWAGIAFLSIPTTALDKYH
jgi:hypothetical protein